MKTVANTKSLVLAAMFAAPLALAPASAQEQAPAQTTAEGEVLTTVYGPTPPALETLAEGPELDGFISARRGDRVQITGEDGSTTVFTVSPETSIRARGGFLGLGRETLGAEALLNGLPITVETRQ